MDQEKHQTENTDIAWCPGCGNFAIRKVLMDLFSELDIRPEERMLVSGIGQAAKMPHYLPCHIFNGLHGRALPPATAIKAANPRLTVIAESGDGDMYGEGGNHFIHTIRRNPDIVNIVHNNMVYGLTKGQASPTSQRNFKTPVQTNGVILEPFNPIATAIALNASFVARASSTDPDQLKKILTQAIEHKGYALVDVFHPCVSFNKVNTYQWYKKNTYPLQDHDPENRLKAFERAIETEKLPLGVFYIHPDKPVFEEIHDVYQENNMPLVSREFNLQQLETFIQDKTEVI